jgi:hypothetical protein
MKIEPAIVSIKETRLRCRVAALTHLHGSVVSAWIVGPESTIKAIRSALNGDGYMNINCNGQHLVFASDEKYMYQAMPLPDGCTWQLAVRTKNEQVIFGEPAEAIKRHIVSRKITTPVLAHWLDWIASRVMEHGLITPVHGWGDNAIKLAFDTRHIDSFVMEGVKENKLQIDEG